MRTRNIEDLNPQTEPSAPIEPEYQEAQDQMSRLDDVLGEISAGWKISIQRMQPGWCRGHLETIQIADDEKAPIGLDYLQEQWGGDVLRVQAKDAKGKVRASVDVPLLSFPPKRWGELLVHPSKRSEQAQVPAQQQNQTLGNIEQLLNVVDKLRGKQAAPQPAPDASTALLEMVKFLLRQQFNQAQPQPQPANNGIQQILEAAKAYQQLKTLFGDADEEKPQPEGNDLLGSIQSILSTYAQIKGTDTPRLSAPNSAPKPNPQPNPQPIAETQPIGSSTPTNLVDAMKTMDGKTIAEMFMRSVAQLPEDKRAQIFGSLFEMLGMAPDGSDNMEDADTDEETDLDRG